MFRPYRWKELLWGKRSTGAKPHVPIKITSLLYTEVNIMKSVLLIGLGRFGRHIAQELTDLGHEVMAIDKLEERVNEVLPFVTNALIGDSTNEEFIDSLGVRNFDFCIVTIGESFQASLETTSLLKEKGALRVISRASRGVHAKFLLRNGADDVVYPERQLAAWCAIRYSSDHLLDYMELDDDHSMVEVEPPSSWIGESIISLNVRKKFGITVLGFKKHGELRLNITPETVIEQGTNLLVLGETRAIRKCFKL